MQVPKVPTLLKICLLVALMTVSAKAELVRVATLVDSTRSDLLDLLSVVEVELSNDPELHLLERREIDQILAEQKLSLSGAVDTVGVVKAGQAMTVDLLAVIRRQSKSGPVSVVVFDAQTGVRYLDKAVAASADPEKIPRQLADTIRSSITEYRSRGEQGKSTVGIFAIRNVSLGSASDSWCAAIASLVEKRLVSSPHLAVLDRTYLEHVTTERAVTIHAPLQKLLAATARVDLEFEQAANDEVMARVTLSLPGGTRHTSQFVASEKESGKIASGIIDELVRRLAVTELPEQDRELEVGLLIAEARFHKEDDDLDRAIVLTEAAFALGHDVAPVQWKLSSLMTGIANEIYREMKPIGLSTWKTRDEPKRREDGVAISLHFAARAADLEVRWEKRKRKEVAPKRRGNRFEYVFADPINASLLNWYQAERETFSEASRSELDHFRAKFNELTDMKLQLAPSTIHFCNSPMQRDLRGIMVHDVRSVRADWPKLQAELIGVVLDCMETQGFRNTKVNSFPDAYHSYASWFEGLMPNLRHRAIVPGRDDWEPLLAKCRLMSQHEKPAVQILGRAGAMICEMNLDMPKERWATEAQQWYAAAESLLTTPAVSGSETELFACYEATLIGIHRLMPYVDRNFDEQLFDHMIQRRELVARVIDSLVEPGLFTVGFNTLYRHSSKRKLQSLERLALVVRLLDEKTSRVVGGNRVLIERMVKDVPRSNDAELAIDSPKPTALIQISDFPDTRMFSAPLVIDNSLYLFGLSGDRGDNSLHVIRTSLDSPSPKILATLKLPDITNKFYGVTHVGELSKLIMVEDHLYCAPVSWGGLIEFDLKDHGVRHLTPKSDPKMPENEIDLIVAAGEKLFAFSNEQPGDSGVVAYEPSGKRWTLIASSRRAKKQTALDHLCSFGSEVVDEPSNHRLLMVIRQDKVYVKPHTHGLYALDTNTFAVSKLANYFAKYNSHELTRVSDDRIWLTHSKLRKTGRHQIITELNPAHPDRNRDIYDPGKGKLKGKPNLYPPYLLIEDQLWSFHPLGQLSLRTGKFNLHPPLGEPVKYNTNFGFSFYRENASRSLLHLPERQSILYGNRSGIWSIPVPTPSPSK